MNNHIAILLSIWVYLKHREISSYLGSSSHPRWKSFSFVTIFQPIFPVISRIASSSLHSPLQSYKIESMEGWANLSTNLSISVYVTLHSILSLLVVDSSIPRKGFLPSLPPSFHSISLSL
ncbi:hypothetical protein PENTCL1PPCAC_18022 [Pristionchus entomophagus]|uniref:G protein-coupled receptor n=1 Tax=Pristionchus entomophagus TaxID=358040 RepID=A0AAV5TNA4_9BILA|nr:hypothetical protein PENTCL1PPCAC_18022 [Pristionchus entomophagus]